MTKIVACVGTIALFVPVIALADPVDEGAYAPPPTSGPPAERGYLFTDDPSLAAPLQVVISAGMGNVTKSGEERPVGSSNIVPTIGAELGILRRLSFYANIGAVFWEQGGMPVSPVTVETGFRILLTNPESHNILFTLQPSYGLDFYGNNTLLLAAEFAWNFHILRIAASFIGSHTFQTDADPVDLEASVGATVKLPLGFHVGVEGVVTDLEEISTAGAEGGSSAFAGPTLGWEWAHRFQIVAGPAYGAGPNYDGWLGRVAAWVYL